MAHEYAVAFTIAGKIGSDFRNAFSSASKSMSAFGKEMQNLNRQASSVDKLMKNRSAAAKLGVEYRQAQAKLREYINTQRQAGGAADKNSAEYRKLAQSVEKTKQAYEKAKTSAKEFAKANNLGGMSNGALGAMRGGLDEKIKKQQKLETAKSRWDAGSTYLMAGGMAVTSVMSDMVQYGAEFEQVIARVGAISNASGDDLAKLEQKARDLGKATEWSAVEVGQGMQFLAMTGMRTNDILAAMPSLLSLASAGAIDLASASDIATNVLSGFGFTGEKAGQQIGHMSDILAMASSRANVDVRMLGESLKYSAPVAKAYGLSMEMATAMTAKLGDAGIQGSEAGTALRAILLRTANAGRKAIETLGVATTEMRNGKTEMRSMDGIMGDLAKRFDEMGSGDKLKWAEAIAGKNASSAFLALVDNSGKIKENFASMSEALKASDGTAAQMAQRQLDTATGQYKILQSAWSEFKITTFKSLGPVLEVVGKGLQKVVDFMNDLSNDAPWLTTTLTVLAGVFGVLAITLPILGAAFAGTTAAVSGFSMAMSFLAANPIILVIGALAILAALIYSFRKEIAELALYVYGKFVEMWTSAWKSVKSAFTSVYNWISDKMESIAEIARSIGRAVSSISFGGGGSGGVSLNAPHMATGGVVDRPTLALIGEGSESEAVIPLSKLESMMSSGGGSGASIAVSFSPVINLSGGGGDVYAEVRRGLDAGAEDLRKQLERVITNQRRVSYA